MGTAETKFKDAMKTGDYQKAYELFFNKKVLRDNINPGDVCYDDGSSLLHQAARHGMQPLYEEFLERESVSPLKQTSLSQNCLHLICSDGKDGEVRRKMLEITLQNGFTTEKGCKSVLGTTDNEGNTPLHLACEYGLIECVEVLMEAHGDLKLKNSNGKTPVDLASESGYKDLANKLETRLVFDPGQSEESLSTVLINAATITPQSTDVHVGMKDQEIQSMKDTLLIETAELLGVSLFTAEALLRNHGWSKEELLDAWMADPAGTCDKAGVEMPSILSLDNIDESLMAAQCGRGSEATEGDCGICCCPIEESVVVPCGHTFCRDCWTQYLNDKITAGNVHNIVCPQYACYRLVPIHIVERLISREMALKYLRFDIKAFVESNPNIRWCPHPGCGQAVQLEELTQLRGLEATPNPGASTSSLSVRCGNNHYFCWGCGKPPHRPCSCEKYGDWLKKCSEMLSKIGNMTADEVSEAASAQWVSSNSKPCPNCKANIEKNDGCNHMRCTKCKHDFCWMCMDPWRKHSSATGGYFECNRYKEINKADDMLKDRKNESEKYERMSHFQHFYSRYSNHQDSLKHEMKYLESADEKMEQLRAAAITAGAEPGSVLFVEEAMRALVEARQTLAASYAYGYFIVYTAERNTFESIQGDFEENVEVLADVVAKPYLRRPRVEIIRLTSLVREKQVKFINDVETYAKPPTPPPRPSWPTPPMRPTRSSSASEFLRQRREERERERERREEEQRRAREEQEEREREQREILDAINASKEDYEQDVQFKSDTELAIFLSMHDKSEKLNDLNAPPNEDSGKTLLPIRPLSLALPNQQSERQDVSSDPSFNDSAFDIEKWRRNLIEWSGSESTTPSPPNSQASFSPPTNPHTHSTNNYGPLYGEDEDLATAIALSLSAVGDEPPSSGKPTSTVETGTTFGTTTPNTAGLTPQLPSRNDLSGRGGQELPHPLRNAMVTATRPAANV